MVEVAGDAGAGGEVLGAGRGAWSDVGATKDVGKRGKKSGKRRKGGDDGSVAGPDETKAGLDKMNAAIGRLASMPTQVVDDCDARWLVAACVAADCVAFTAAAARVDSCSVDDDSTVLFAAVDVMAARAKSRREVRQRRRGVGVVCPRRVDFQNASDFRGCLAGDDQTHREASEEESR